MSNRQSISRRRLGLGLGVLLALAVPAGLGLWWPSAHPVGGVGDASPPLRESTLAELVRRDGRLKSHTRFEAGKIVKREFFPEGGQAPPPAETAGTP